MADRGRDFKVSFLSDTDRFDLSQPAEELERLGDAAKNSQKALDTSMDRMEKSVDGVGDKAKATASKVDDAFDRIAKSSKASMRKADNAMDEFKDEAHDTGREAAASFSGGFDDITDAVQEIGANAFSKLGKQGMLAGGALAIALGFVVSKAQEANEKVKELRDNFFEFMKSTDSNNAAKGLQEFMDSMDADQINDFNDAIKATGISQKDFYEAMAQGGDKAKALRDRLNDMVGINMPWDQQSMEAQHLSNALGDTIKAHEGAGDAAEAYSDVVGDAIKKQERYENAVSGVEGALRRIGDQSTTTADVVTEKAQAMADATEDPKDAWSDFADDVELSAGDIIRVLDEQTKAMQNFQKNLATVAEAGNAEFLAWVEEQPPAVAAAYAKGSAAERSRIVAAFERNVGAAQGEGIAKGLSASEGSVERAAAAVRGAAKRAAIGDGPIQIPTTVKPPPAGAAAQIRRDVQNAMKPVVIPVMLQNVTPSTWSRYVP